MFPKIFDAMLALSFIAVIFVVLRLYNALKVLNARVTILSSLVKKMSASMQHQGDSEDQSILEFQKKEQQLREEMSRDFTYKDFSYEEIRKVKAQSLVRPDAAERASGSFMAVGTSAGKELDKISTQNQEEPESSDVEGSTPLSI